LIGPRETSAKIGTGTAEDVVLDDVDGKADVDDVDGKVFPDGDQS
jgi:hypothetical protein